MMLRVDARCEREGVCFLREVFLENCCTSWDGNLPVSISVLLFDIRTRISSPYVCLNCSIFCFERNRPLIRIRSSAIFLRDEYWIFLRKFRFLFLKRSILAALSCFQDGDCMNSDDDSVTLAETCAKVSTFFTGGCGAMENKSGLYAEAGIVNGDTLGQDIACWCCSPICC